VEHYGFSCLSIQSPAPNDFKSENTPNFSNNSVKESDFVDVQGLLEYATKNWRKRLLLRDIQGEVVLEALVRRPFFLLVSVEAPLMLRWKRSIVKSVASGNNPYHADALQV
jgi:dCMP deaminase